MADTTTTTTTDTTPAKPVMNEIASIERDPRALTFGRILRNEDDTLLTRGGGKGLKIYDELERDCHAYAVLQKRKLAVISRPWDVTPATETPEDEAAAELVREALERIEFDRICMELLDATLKGYAVGEVMWEVHEGRVLPRDVLARKQTRFVFDKQNLPRLLTIENMVEGEELPARKFVVHRFGAKDGSPYGHGLGSRLFWPVMFKRQGVTFWLVFADKFGSPTALGKYPPGSDKKDQDKLLAALQAIAQDAGITVPEGMTIEFLEAARSGAGDTYDTLVRYMDEQISKAVLGETMSTTASAAGLGSGQANVQNDVRLEISKADADLLSATLAETLVQWIVDFNMPGAGVPLVYRDFSEPEDLKARAERDKVIGELGYEPTEKYMTETYGDGFVKKAAPEPVVNNMLPGGPQPPVVPVVDDDDEAAFAEGATAQRRENRDDQEALAQAAETISRKWRELMGQRVDDLRAMLDETGDLAQFRERLNDLVNERPPEQLVESIARATFAAHVIGRGQETKPESTLSKYSRKLRDLVRRRKG